MSIDHKEAGFVIDPDDAVLCVEAAATWGMLALGKVDSRSPDSLTAVFVDRPEHATSFENSAGPRNDGLEFVFRQF